jgi:hypothetical protein
MIFSRRNRDENDDTQYKDRFGLTRRELHDLSKYNAEKNKYVFQPEYEERMKQLQSIFDTSQERHLIEQGYQRDPGTGVWFKHT